MSDAPEPEAADAPPADEPSASADPGAAASTDSGSDGTGAATSADETRSDSTSDADPWHTVLEGEDISSIATQYGFHNWRTIWNDENNASVRDERGDASAIEPGDKLFIPDVDPKKLPLADDPDVENVSVVHSEHVDEASDTRKLQLRFVDADGKPVAKVAGTLTWGDATLDVATDDDGCLEADVAPTPNQGTLSLQVFEGDPLTVTVWLPATDEEHDWGDPATVPGARARMSNLGYLFLAGPPATTLGAPADDAFARGLDRVRGAPLATGDAAVDAEAARLLAERHDGSKEPTE